VKTVVREFGLVEATLGFMMTAIVLNMVTEEVSVGYGDGRGAILTYEGEHVGLVLKMVAACTKGAKRVWRCDELGEVVVSDKYQF